MGGYNILKLEMSDHMNKWSAAHSKWTDIEILSLVYRIFWLAKINGWTFPGLIGYLKYCVDISWWLTVIITTDNFNLDYGLLINCIINTLSVS